MEGKGSGEMEFDRHIEEGIDRESERPVNNFN